MFDYSQQMCEEARKRLYDNKYKNLQERIQDQQLVMLCHIAESAESNKELGPKVNTIARHVEEIDRLKRRFLLITASSIALFTGVAEAVGHFAGLF